MNHLRQQLSEDDAPRSEPLFFQPATGGVAGNGKPIFSWDQAAAQITRDGVSWAAALGQPVTITYAFRSSVTTAETAQWIPGVSGFAPFNASQIAVAEQMLHLWSEVANVNFVRVGAGTSGAGAYSNNAQILFGNFTTGPAAFSAFTYLPPVMGTPGEDIDGNLWVNVSRNYDANPAAFPLGAHILAHEIGHALGLNHPGDYNGGASGGAMYTADASMWQDTAMFSNMSYFNASFTGGDYGSNYALAPQMLDIAAIQRLYGANLSTRVSNTTYGFHANAGDAVFSVSAANQTAIFCIWDAGGTDTLDLSGYATNSEIDLRPESFSSAGPDGVGGAAKFNISIARGVTIENAIGGSGNDTIIGNSAGNLLDGGAGGDQMSGGLGNDTYVVNSTADVVTEAVSAGTDTVRSSISFTLGANLENLTLTGTAAINGTGNSANNTIAGNAGANTLNGGAGADALAGGAGNDRYIVDNVGDVVTEATNAGVDLVQASVSYFLSGNVENLTLTGSGSINGAGNALGNTIIGNIAANVLSGGDGDDILNGGAGADHLDGGAGNDTASYSTATSGVVASLASAGVNTGDAAGDSYTSVERLTGSAFADTLTGTTGNNIINGGAGADVMSGGAGNDTYVIDNVADVVIEAANAGIDQVQSAIKYALGANVESLRLTGSGSINGTGNALANVITGSTGNNVINGLGGDDTLNGGEGNDTLIGGAGADHFVFSVLATAAHDTISDFVALDDDIRLDNAAFTAIGPEGALNSAAFWASATGLAHDSNDRVVYNTTTGQLFYDTDGSGAGAALLIATLTNHPTITSLDIFVI